MANQQSGVQVVNWTGAQHPTLSTITRLLEKENLRPYKWSNTPNYRYAVRSHNANKIVYVVEGSIEVQLPDYNQLLKLRPGDRLNIPAGVRHSITVGPSGAHCVECAIDPKKA
jgi:quercetin dioxygenase-like cupin family protein